MKCEDVEVGLIAYVHERATPSERRDVESHLAGCAVCRARVNEFRNLADLLSEVPAVEPSFGFDARLRQRLAAQPRRAGWFAWFVPQARLALSAAVLVALTVWMVKLPASHSPAPVPQPAAAAASSDQDFNAIEDLGVLENYDVVTNMDALSQLAPAKAPETQKSDADQTQSND